MASETVDPSDWSHPHLHRQYPMSAFVHSINRCSLCRESTLQLTACEATTLPMQPIRVYSTVHISFREAKSQQKLIIMNIYLFLFAIFLLINNLIGFHQQFPTEIPTEIKQWQCLWGLGLLQLMSKHLVCPTWACVTYNNNNNNNNNNNVKVYNRGAFIEACYDIFFKWNNRGH